MRHLVMKALNGDRFAMRLFLPPTNRRSFGRQVPSEDHSPRIGAQQQMVPRREEQRLHPTAMAGEGITIGMAYDIGGRGDKSFNDSAFSGVEEAQEKLDVEVVHADWHGVEQNEATLEQCPSTTLIHPIYSPTQSLSALTLLNVSEAKTNRAKLRKYAFMTILRNL